MSSPIGLDIGGANIKAADQNQAASVPFALWKTPHLLADALQSVLESFPANVPLAVTMTGELADCFETRSEGVNHILDAVETAAAGRLVGVWQSAGEFVSVEDARYLPQLVASANWHALATWAARMSPMERSLVVDIGSTTCDVIPVEKGFPDVRGLTDRERLAAGELLYLGVRRTPLCSVVNEVTFLGKRTSLARELFATTQDIHVILGDIPEEPESFSTANGRPLTISHSLDRLARMVCSDRDETSEEELRDLATSFDTIEQLLVLGAIKKAWKLQTVPAMILLAGEGEFLARKVIATASIFPADVEVLSLNQLLGPQFSTAACAFAVSKLAEERQFENSITAF